MKRREFLEASASAAALAAMTRPVQAQGEPTI
jgi:hypothetical protein